MSAANSDHTFCACLLDLKKEAIVGVDGQSIALKTDDFIGVHNLDNREFHLLIAKGQSNSTLISAFALFQEDTNFVRRYDPQTEEISSLPVDPLTEDNLSRQIPGFTSTSRLLEYSQIVSDSGVQNWKMQTKHILSSNILRVRGITSGEKLIPGSYEQDDDNILPTSSSRDGNANQDGRYVVYPPIPVVDSSLSIWKSRHTGTKRYLHKLSPTERTSLFTNDSAAAIANRLFQDVLQKYYEKSWETMLGDLQLSYTLFLYLNCFSSLEHWKDMVAMICLVDAKGIRNQAEFYRGLIPVLHSQISTIDQGFLEDVDEAGDNFLLPLLRKLCQNMSASKVIEDKLFSRFRSLLVNRFPNSFATNHTDDRMESDDDDDDDEDGPTIVSTEYIEASLARSSAQPQLRPQSTIPMDIRQEYSFLVAAVMPQEDIVMTCARILDEKKDVSLVREAAAYLEEVEQQKSY